MARIRAWACGLRSRRPCASRGRARSSAYRVSPVTLAQASILGRSEEHTSELQSLAYLVCRLLLEKKKIALLSYYEKFEEMCLGMGFTCICLFPPCPCLFDCGLQLLLFVCATYCGNTCDDTTTQHT